MKLKRFAIYSFSTVLTISTALSAFPGLSAQKCPTNDPTRNPGCIITTLDSTANGFEPTPTEPPVGTGGTGTR